jgi:hypothetical protein
MSSPRSLRAQHGGRFHPGRLSLNRPAEFGRLYDCAHSQRNSLVLGLPVRQFRSIAQSAVARLSNIQRAKTLIRSL